MPAFMGGILTAEAGRRSSSASGCTRSTELRLHALVDFRCRDRLHHPRLDLREPPFRDVDRLAVEVAIVALREALMYDVVVPEQAAVA